MSAHPEERRIAGLLRELIVQSGKALDGVEQHLGWASGRLRELLDGNLRLSFEDVLEILPLLNTTPPDFFAWLYGFEPGASMPGIAEPQKARVSGDGSAPGQQALDRRFEQSLRAVKKAISRRSAWKRERDDAERP
jgi:hypothetical protein